MTRRQVQRAGADHGEAVALDGVRVRPSSRLPRADGDIPPHALARRVDPVCMIRGEDQLLRDDQDGRQHARLLGTSAQPSAWRWGSGLGAPTREGTPKHATGTCACPSQLRASESAFVAPSRVKRPPPRPPAPRSLVQTFLRGQGHPAGTSIREYVYVVIRDRHAALTYCSARSDTTSGEATHSCLLVPPCPWSRSHSSLPRAILDRASRRAWHPLRPTESSASQAITPWIKRSISSRAFSMPGVSRCSRWSITVERQRRQD